MVVVWKLSALVTPAGSPYLGIRGTDCLTHPAGCFFQEERRLMVFWLGFLVGGMAGACVGVVVFGLLLHAAEATRTVDDA